MGDKYSPLEELRLLKAGGETRDAILNPNTDTERFLNSLGLAGKGAAQNIGGLFSNMIDIGVEAGGGKQAPIVSDYLESANDLSSAEDLWNLAKLPFSQPTGTEDSIFDTALKDSKLEKARMDAKDKLGKQFSEGGFGTIAGEIVKAAPIMKFGTMSNFNKISKLGGTSLDKAQAVALDTIKNIGSMGVSEAGLSKFYGESDKEALEKGIVAGATAGLGTPLLASGKILGKKAFKASDKLEEEVTSMAGGGTPPKVKPSSTDRKEMQNVKVNIGEEIPKQEKVVTPKVKKFDETFDDKRGRNYSSSWLNSHQGKSTSKASVIKLPEHEIKDVDAYVNSMGRSFKSHLDTVETYGSADTKFKSKGYLTNAEKMQTQKAFEKDLLFKLSKDDRLSVADKRIVREKAKKLNSTLEITKDYFPKGLDEQTEISFGNQKVKYQTPSKYNAEMNTQWEHLHSKPKGKDYVHGNIEEIGAFSWSKELQDMAKESPKKAREYIVKNVESKLDDKAFIEAIDKIETRMATKGQKFDINKVPEKVKYENQDEYYKIEDYINRRNDIALVKSKDITSKEFAWRESKRLDAQSKRNNIVGNKFESTEDLAKAVEAQDKTYSDIGMYRQTKAKEKTYSDSPNKAEDKTDLIALGKKRDSKLNALDEYRKNGKILRVNSNKYGRGGEPVLTKSEIRDIDEFKDVLTNEEILNKTQPLVRDSERKVAIENARQLAKNKVKARQAKKLGIDFNFLPKEIKFSQTIMDAKNSMGQIASVITGSKELASKVFLKSGEKELRQIIGEELGKKLGRELGKDEIKTPFMIKGYGSEKDGLARAVMKENSWLKSEDEAYQFIDMFNEEFAKQAKPLSELMDIIKDIHASRKNPVYEWTMPDGYKVKFDLSEYKDYVVKGSKGQGVAKVRTERIDKMSRALMPNIFHSIDGWIAREMRTRMNIQSTHDAFHIPKGREAEADVVYRDILKELNNSNVIGDIFEQLGHKGYQKVGKLDDDFFSKDRKILGTEHKAGTKEVSERATPTAGKQMSESEVMRDFMSTSSHRNHEYFKMVDAMIDESVITKHNMGIARTEDDVFERALAYAMQGNKFDKSKAIEPPAGSKISESAWYSEQEKLFNEFRAKAELNPDLAESIKGERKFFNIDHEVIGQTVRSKRQIREETLRFLKSRDAILKAKGLDTEINSMKEVRTDNLKSKEKIKVGKASEIIDEDIEKLALEQQFIDAQKYSKGENFFSKSENKTSDTFKYERDVTNLDIEAPKGFKDSILKHSRESFEHVSEKFNDTKAYKQYQKLIGVTKVPQKAAEQAGDTLKKYVDDLLKGQDQLEWSRKIFETDARAIREFKTEAEAKVFFDEHIALYNRTKSEVDQLAKAIGSEEHQVGAFLNNAKAIAEKHKLNAEAVDILDKLISIKAMEQNDAWKFYEKHHGSDIFDELMNISDSMHKRSTTLFAHDKAVNKQVKGYLSEHYDGGKQITEDGKVIWDAETKFEDGALGLDLASAKVGKMETKEIDKNMFSSDAQMIDFALKNNLKITDKGWRKIPSGKIKDKAGRNHNLSDRLGMTEASIRAKSAQYDSAVRILTDEGAYDTMFSKTAKEGFTPVTKEQLEKMPWIMRKEVLFVNTNYAEKLLGRQEPRLIRKNATQIEKVVDKTITGLVTMFKQAVVLKNPASYKSAVLVNFSTTMLIDANPIRMTRNAKQAFDVFTEYNSLVKEFDLLQSGASGKQKYPKDADSQTKAKIDAKYLKELQDKLANNDIQKYLDLGLSINTLDGVRGSSSLLSYMASDATGNRLDKIGNEILINQRGTTGNIAKNVFSFVDFQGRYMAIKALENNNVKSADAVRRANDLFGQMDDMAPAFVQIIDKYGAFVFAKWLASVAPSVLKAAKNNPKKALAITLGLYYLSDETNTMFSNVSPVEGVVDMMEGGVTGDGWVWNAKHTTSLIPGVYRDMWKQSAYALDDTQHWHQPPAILWKNRQEAWINKDGETIDFRGITQKSLDFINPTKD